MPESSTICQTCHQIVPGTLQECPNCGAAIVFVSQLGEELPSSPPAMRRKLFHKRPVYKLGQRLLIYRTLTHQRIAASRLFSCVGLLLALGLFCFGSWNFAQWGVDRAGNLSFSWADVFPSSTPTASPTSTLIPTSSPTPLPTLTSTPTLLPQTQPITVKNINQVEELFRWPAGAEIVSLAFSPDEKLLASGDSKGTVKVWAGWQTTPVFEFPGTHAAFSADGMWIGVAGPVGVNLYLAADGSLVRSLGPARPYYSIVFSPDSQMVVAGSNINKFFIWNTNDGSEQKPGGGFAWPVHSLSFSRDGRLLATASNDLTYVWNLQEQKVQRGLQPPKQQEQPIYFSAALDSDGEWYATGQKNGQMDIWRVSNGERMEGFDDQSRFVHGLQFLHGSNPTEVLVSGDEVNLSFWTMKGYRTSHHRSIFISSPIRSLAISLQNRLIATGGQDGIIRLWGVSP